MKAFYAVLFILVLGGVYYFVSNPAETEVKEMNDIEVHNEEDNSQESMSDDSMEDDKSKEEVELEIGGDVGMEFPIPDDESILETKTFNLDGFNYGYDVKEIRVKEGDTVTVNLSVSEGFHDWVVDEFDAATEKIREGGLTSVTFVASKTGTYEYYCSVGQHRASGMVGKLIVE